VPSRLARNALSIVSPLRAGQCVGLAALALIVCNNTLETAVANGDTRALTLRHNHRDDEITVTFKRDGKYDDEGLRQLNHFLRDWRNDTEISMDPHLFDIVWEVYREVGGKEPIHIISAYRSPETNAFLRAHSSGVALHSQHILGKAMDFFIPGVPLEELRYAGLRLQRGGVGFYPTSGSPFVHMDTGGVRHWPRMAPEMLARVLSMPKATLFAAAERRRMPTTTSDEDESEAPRTVASLAPAPAPARKPQAKPTAIGTAPNAQQAFALASDSSTPFTLGSTPRRAAAPEPAAATTASVQSWLNDIDQRPSANDRVAPEMALAYARDASVENPRAAATVATPMAASRLPPPATTQVPKTAGKPIIQARPGQRYNDPWMRSITLASSLHYSKVTAYGSFDVRGVQTLMRKPATTFALTFRNDPYDGMTSLKFSGPAVSFLPMMMFAGTPQRQASLQ